MKRLHALALALCFLALGPTRLAEAQCSKRILIYLDVSGSMDPRGRDSSSPYRLSVEALGSLLREPDFVGPNDVIEANTFGRSPARLAESRGPGNVEVLLNKLASYSNLALETDIAEALKAAQESLAGSASFNRQVVVLASDFAHEPRDGMPLGEAATSWRSSFASLRDSLRQRFAPEQNVSLVLLEAPIRGGSRESFNRAMQQNVITSLQDVASGASLTSLDPTGQVDASAIAATIRNSLLRSVEIGQVTRARGRRERIQVTLTNPNCAPTTIEALTLTCFPGSATTGQPVQVDLPSDQRALSAAGSAGETRTIDVALPSGPCWEADGSRFETAVRTPEGLEGRGSGTTGTWLQATSKNAVLDKRWLFFSDLLRLEIDLRGVYVHPTSFRVEVMPVGDSNGPALASGTFYAPASLDPGQNRPYRLLLRAKRQVAERIDTGEALTIKIPAPTSAGGDLRVRTQDWTALAEWLNSLVSGGTLLAVTFMLLRRKKDEDREAVIGRANLWSWLIGVLIFVATLFAMWSQHWLLQHAGFLITDALQALPVSFGVTVLLFFVLRNQVIANLDAAVKKGDVRTPEELRKRAHQGPRVFILCMAVFVVTSAAGFILRSQARPEGDGGVEILKVEQP